MPLPRDADQIDGTFVNPVTDAGAAADTHPPTPDTSDTAEQPAVPAESTFVAPPPVFAEAVTAVPPPGPADREGTLVRPPDFMRTLVPPPDRAATLVPGDGWEPPAPGGTMAGPTAVPTPARAAMPVAPNRVVGRFALRNLHAKGGLGEVYTARDTELNRDVALKLIKSQFADDPGSRRRFLSEAEITARLDHPGVVPVFGLVADGHGRPCYAMRFIRGETLKDEIDRFHQTSGDMSTGATAARRVAFRQLLQRFIAVCQAIGYAHTRGVIHRDIKPHNVMVGTFGETLVVDWGLAKVVGDLTPDRPSGMIRPPTLDADATEELTTMGTAVGTPAYMPPEQAAGRVDEFGPRSDIYSLGATLYCLLVGKAPFTGGTTDEVVQRVIKGDFPRPREVKPDVPRPLEAVALKAMALKQPDRYQDALALAADVERWLSDEPVSCYRESLKARVARWVRRRPARVAAVSSLLLTGLLGVAAVLWFVNDERKNTDKARRDAEAARDVATAAEQNAVASRDAETAAKKAAEKSLVQETAAKETAAKRSRIALEAFDLIVKDVQDQLADRAGTQALREELLRRAQQGLQKLLDTAGGDQLPADHTFFTAYARMGDLRLALGDTAGAFREYAQAVAVARNEVERHPDDLQGKRDLGAGLARQAEAYLRTGDTAKAQKAAEVSLLVRIEVRAAAPDRDARRELAAGYRQKAAVLLELGNTAAALEACRAGLTLRTQLLSEAEASADVPDRDRLLTELRRELAESRDQEADILLRTGMTGPALDAATASHDLREKVVAALDRTDTQRERAAALDRLGEVHTERGNITDARAAVEKECTVLAEALHKDPQSAGARADLAAARGRLGTLLLRICERGAALGQTAESVKLCEQLTKDDPESAAAKRELAHAHERHGDALLAGDQKAAALAEYRASETILSGLWAKDTTSGRRREELSRALLRVGDALLAADRVREALEAYDESRRHRQTGVDADPASARARRLLYQAWERLYSAHRAAGNTVEAKAAAYHALDTAGELERADMQSAVAKRDLAVARGKWALALAEVGERGVALVAWHKAVEAYKELVEKDPSPGAREDLANAESWLAEAYTRAGLFKPALAAANRSLTIRREIADAHASDWLPRRNLARSHRVIGDVYAQQLDPKADGHYKDALEAAKAITDLAARATEVAAVERQRQVCAAIAAGRTGANLAAYPPDVRAAALVVVIDVRLQGRRAADAAAAADGLAAAARGPEDVYVAARTHAACAAAAKSDGERKVYAAQAVKHLDRAVREGFRDASRLEAPPWGVMRSDPAFAALTAAVRALPALAPLPRLAAAR